MIYTVTINPSIDYIVQLPELHLGLVNRMAYDNKLPGGKGSMFPAFSVNWAMTVLPGALWVVLQGGLLPMLWKRMV